MTRRGCGLLLLLFAASMAVGAEIAPGAPKVPGLLRLHQRSRVTGANGAARVVERVVRWKVAETAIIVCDMWDRHYCHSAEQRLAVLAPRMNQVLTAARSNGVTILHAPSGTMPFYKETPFRMRMMQARPSVPPVPIAAARDFDPSREGPWPIDDAVLPCDDPVIGDPVGLATRQVAAIDISGFDGVSDSGEEIYNFCVQEGIKNLVFVGVHTNKCVLSRSFSIRQMVDLGMNVVLARDLTDGTYDPRKRPYVSHARGVELVIEHIERYWCPSILADDLTRVVPGSADLRRN